MSALSILQKIHPDVIMQNAECIKQAVHTVNADFRHLASDISTVGKTEHGCQVAHS